MRNVGTKVFESSLNLFDEEPITVFRDMSVRKSGAIQAGIALTMIRIKSNRVEFDYVINAGTSVLSGTLVSHISEESPMTTAIKELAALAEDSFNQIRKVR